MVERILSVFPLDSLDTVLLNTARRYWMRRNPHLPKDKFDSLFRCSPDFSSVWYTDHQENILNQYKRRLSQFGIEPLA